MVDRFWDFTAYSDKGTQSISFFFFFFFIFVARTHLQDGILSELKLFCYLYVVFFSVLLVLLYEIVDLYGVVKNLMLQFFKV